ncbi:CDP-glycerol glycerophosphotransferase family protein [Mumia zhuanghuii]|uniref:CDP-glycerol glycerophosphotransferase family protein n=1 Tax=Mumia zhuanghuii TaxID=2585211 RepID=UPI0036324148
MTGKEQDLATWWAFARAWDQERRSSPERAEEMLREAIDAGPATPCGKVSVERPSASMLRNCAVALVRASGVLDESAYLEAHGLAGDGTVDAVEHFCTRGWRELLNPAPSFDVWWYWHEHLDPGSDALNPVVHHLLVGRRAGLSTSPLGPVPADLPATAPRAEPRRAVLFAGSDPDGRLDETTLSYVHELDRFGDVHLLVGEATSASELAALPDSVVSATARSYGDGSSGAAFALLADEVVGWERLAEYDEIILVDDSSYLVGALDDLFASAARATADVWTPQRLLTTATWSASQAWLPGAMFVVLRRPVVVDRAFRKQFLSSVSGVPRSMASTAFWAGLAHRVHAGDHRVGGRWEAPDGEDMPLTEDAFALLGDGFPLLRRALLAENPYDVPDLAQWERRVRAVLPEAPVEAVGRHLRRVAPDDALRRSFAITRRETGEVVVPEMLTDDDFRAADVASPTFEHWWAFPVCAYDHTFAGNERAVFEEVRDDPSIKKIVLTRSRRVEVGGENVVVVPLRSPEGQHHLLRSGQVFVKHTPLVNVPFPLSPDRHNFVNLWHGIPLKRFGYVAHDTTTRRATIVRHHVGCRAVITSSHTDSLSMKAAFHPLTLDQMWRTGLPRNDFVTREDSRLPVDLLASVERLRGEVGDRRLVMFLPTFKNDQAKAYYEFSDDEIGWLADWCARENVVIGIREHMADTAHSYSRMLAPLQPVDMSSRKYPDLEVLYRVASGLVTDYSSCVVDFLLTGKPVVSFAYDYEHYTSTERGLFYDLDQVLPGPVCRDFAAFGDALDVLFVDRTPAEKEEYAWRRQVFFDHLDDRSASRVVERVKALYVDGILCSEPT